MSENVRLLRFGAGYVIIACACAYRWLPPHWNSIVAGVLCQQAINIAYFAGRKSAEPKTTS